MLQKDLLLQELQKQLHNADNDEVKIMINNLMADVLVGKFNIKVW